MPWGGGGSVSREAVGSQCCEGQSSLYFSTPPYAVARRRRLRNGKELSAFSIFFQFLFLRLTLFVLRSLFRCPRMFMTQCSESNGVQPGLSFGAFFAIQKGQLIS